MDATPEIGHRMETGIASGAGVGTEVRYSGSGGDASPRQTPSTNKRGAPR